MMLANETIEHARKTDLLGLIGTDTELRRVANTRGGELAGACPFCGGQKRFRVQPNHEPYPRWFCRHCTNAAWQSAIDYVMRRENLNFAGAVTRMNDNVLSVNFTPARVQSESSEKSESGPPNAVWQERAREFVADCESQLWSAQGARARMWLNARGLTDETLRAWRIGFNADEAFESPARWGLPTEKNENGRIKNVYLPRGVVIPCTIADQIWYIKIRRAQGNSKYLNLRGWRSALFGAATLTQSDVAIIVEGEFDALLAWQELQHAEDSMLREIGVCTPGSATNRIQIADWAEYLLPIARFLVCYDADAEGARGAEWWSELSRRVRRVTIPKLNSSDKDLTDFYKSGGRILDLISFELMRDEIKGFEIDAPTLTAKADVTPIESKVEIAPATLRPSVSTCWNCKATRFWQRPADGGWVCAVCHPPLPNCAVKDFDASIRAESKS